MYVIVICQAAIISIFLVIRSLFPILLFISLFHERPVVVNCYVTPFHWIGLVILHLIIHVVTETWRAGPHSLESRVSIQQLAWANFSLLADKEFANTRRWATLALELAKMTWGCVFSAFSCLRLKLSNNSGFSKLLTFKIRNIRCIRDFAHYCTDVNGNKMLL